MDAQHEKTRRFILKIFERLRIFCNRVIKIEKERRWRIGYRRSGYMKMRLAAGMLPIPWDLWLFHMVEGVEIPPHRDVARGRFAERRAYRLNWIVKSAKRGGVFYTEKSVFNLFNRLILFRVDTCTHGVTKIEHGERYMLSFGFTLAPRKGEIIPKAHMGKWNID